MKFIQGNKPNEWWEPKSYQLFVYNMYIKECVGFGKQEVLDTHHGFYITKNEGDLYISKDKGYIRRILLEEEDKFDHNGANWKY